MPRSARKASATTSGAASKKKSTATTATDKRKSSRITKAALSSNTDEEEEEERENDNEEDEESSSVVERPRKRTKRESTTDATDNSNKKKRTKKDSGSNRRKTNETMKHTPSTKKKHEVKEEQEDEDEDEDEDETMDSTHGEDENEEDEGGKSDELLAHMTSKKYGQIFTAPSDSVEAKQRHTMESSKLPLILVHTICDIIPASSLFSLARVSRSAYAMVREYGESVVATESKRSVTSDPLGDDIEFIGSVVGPVNPNPRPRLGQRPLKDSLVLRYSSDVLRRLVTSRLRLLIASLTIEFAVDLDQLSIVSDALPYLRSLALNRLRSKKERVIAFPHYLRSLSVSFVTHGTASFRQSWMRRLGTALGELEYLNELRLTYAHELVKCLMKSPRLRLFHSSFANLISTYEQLIAFPSTLTSFSQDLSGYWYTTQPTLKAPSDDPTSTSTSTTLVLSLRTVDLCLRMDQVHIKPLSQFVATLTSINPSKWETPDVAWLSAFTQLRVLTINSSLSCNDKGDEVFRHLNSESFRIDSKVLVDTLCQLTRLTKLRLYVHRLENDQLMTVLKSLTLLEHFGIGSPQVTSIACFLQIPHLTSQLDTLTLRLPKLPRDEVVHLYSLKWLSSLDISGSFSEPLYARQLFPFKSPPTQQQPYLRRFIPRSSNEAVPIPPIDLALQAAQRTEFNERVQSGQVCSAEIMNSDQLSLILQQLDCKEFSFAARTCRSWRSAASLKSAWSSGNTGRTLVLEGDAPECVPSIMPQLPLWRYARRVKFFVRSASTGPSGNLGSSFAARLDTLSQLTRLESLLLHCPSHFGEPIDCAVPVRSFLSQIESRLIVLGVRGSRIGQDYAAGLRSSAVHEFPRVRSLEIIDASLYILPKWMAMVELRALKLSVMPSGWGEGLRRLSLSHQLRRLELDVSAARMDELSQFIHHLADRRVPSSTSTLTSAFPTSADSSAVAIHSTAGSSSRQPAAIEVLSILLTQPESMNSLDPLCYLPQLTDLRIEVIPKTNNNYSHRTPLPMSGWNFSQWTQRDAFQQLERFYYDGPFDGTQLHHLAQAKQIRFLTLIDRWQLYQIQSGIRGCSWTRPNRNSLLAGCMIQWLKVWTRLEEFHIEGIQIIGSELNEFTRVAETLRTFHLHHVSTNPLLVSNFSFLTHCQHLESIELNCILGLTLSPRHTWFDGITADSAATVVSANQSAAVIDRDGDTEMKSDTLSGTADITDAAATTGAATSDSSSAAAAAAAATDVAAVVAESSTSLIELIRSCPELTRMTWCLHPTDLDASVEFTLKNAKIGRQSLDVRREREWTRERYTLKSKLHNRKANDHAQLIVIRYISCCETTVQLKYGQHQQLITAEERINISASQSSLDPNDRDLIAHHEEKEALKKQKTTVESKKKRKAEPSVD